MHEYIQLVAGATLTAVDALKSDVCDIAICWDGGRLGLLVFTNNESYPI